MEGEHISFNLHLIKYDFYTKGNDSVSIYDSNPVSSFSFCVHA